MSPESISILTGLFVVLLGAAFLRPKMRKADWEHIVKPQLWQTQSQSKEPGTSFYDRNMRRIATDYEPAFKKLKQWLNLDEKNLSKKIYQAGSSWKTEEIITIQIVSVVLGFALFCFSLFIMDNTIGEVLGLFVGVAGYWYPGMRLSDETKRRRRQIQMALPDFLDLFVTLLEVGTPPQDAILQVSDSFKGAAGEEFRRAAIKSKYNGGNWIAALEEMAETISLEEVSDLVSAIVIASEKGTPLSPILRDQVARHRYKQQQDYEEKAGKAGTKILPVMALFILMPLLVLLLAPAFSNFKGF